MKFVLFSWIYSFVIFGTRCALCDVWDEVDQQILVDDIIIPELYLGYRRALDNSNEDTVSYRRVIRNNKEYDIHVHKLKDVNGLKRHNLIVKEKSSDHPLIYVSNPVETRIPNAYLSLEGFKELLTGRVLRQREEFKENKPEAFITLKRAKHLTTKRKNAVTKSQRKPTKKHTSNIKLKKRKSTSKAKNATANEPVSKHKKLKTNHRVKSSPKLKITSKLVRKESTTPKRVIDRTTTNTPTLVHNVVRFNVDSTSKLDQSNSIASILPREHHIIRTDANKPIKTVEVFTKNVTKVSIATEKTTNTVAVSETEECEYSREIKEKENIEEKFLVTTVTLDFGTTEDTTIKESTLKESIIKESTPGEFTAAESTTEKFTTVESTSVESTTINATTEDTTTETSTTKEFTSETATREITTKEPTTEEFTTTTEGTIYKESTTEVTNTEESTIKKPTKPRRKKLTIISKMPKTKRTTLGRPLVFMGGY